MPRTSAAPFRSSPSRLATPARGWSLLELLLTVAALLTLVTAGLPKLQNWRASQVLQASAAELESQVRFARSMALSLDTPVRLTLLALPDGQGSCTVVHTGAANACSCDTAGRAVCTAGTRALASTLQQLRRDGLLISTTGRSLVFAPGKATVTPTATLVVTNQAGQSVRKIVNIVGRVRTCSPSQLAGIPPCT